MARKKDSSVSKKTGRVDFKDIVWCIDNLTETQLENHDENPCDAVTVMDYATQMVEKNFKLSMRWDDYSQCFMVSAVCDVHGYDNSGLAISARGDDFLDAFSIMFYKFFVVAEQDLRGFADKKPKSVRG